MSITKKIISVGVSLTTAVWLSGAVMLIPAAQAATAAELQTQINALLASIQLLQTQLGATQAASYTFTKDLTLGSKGADVTALQNLLISANKGAKAVALAAVGATGTFGNLTQAALAEYQTAAGVSPAAGYFGVKTRAYVASLAIAPVTPTFPAGCTSATGFSATTGLSCAAAVVTFPAGCTSATGFSTTTGLSCAGTTTTATTTTATTTLTGGAGSVESYDLVSGLSGEEVGEDENDVKVAGLEIEADANSDIQLTAVRLEFDEGAGATSDFEDYVDEVSILLGSDEVARVDGDEFNDDNDWSKTVSLDSGAVILAGKTANLYVALSGVSNLDTADTGDEWDVDFTSVRFKDAQGASISEDPTVAVITFSFESFATAANVAFKITSGDEDVNDAHVINVDATDETDNVSILSFNVGIEGDSDVNLDALPVTVTVATQDNVDEMVSGLSLWMDGEEVGTVTMTADCLTDANCVAVGAAEDYLFDDLDLDLNADEDYDFLVKADLYGITDTGDLTAGDTILAAFGETETDNASFDAEDESGEDLADGDITGTVTSSASEVRDIGIMVELVGTPTAVISHTGNIVGSGAGDDDQGTFTIVFDVTAFDGDVYVDGTAPDLTGGATEDDLDLTTTGTAALTSATITSPTGATLTGTVNADARFLVSEDETERFQVTAVSTVSADGFVNISLESILYALTDVDGDIVYTFNLGDFQTGNLFMNAN